MSVITSRPAQARPTTRATTLATAAAGAALAVGVAVVHVIDQGGVLALRDPAWLGYAYWLQEASALVTAVLLLTGRRAAGWLLAVGVSAGPLAGIVVSRTVGLPGATDDIGSWSEPIGVAATLVEATLLLLAVTAPRRPRRV